MVRAIKEIVTIQPGGLIEIRRADLPVGASAEVIVMVEEPAETRQAPLASFFGKGKGCFQSAAEVDQFIRAERDHGIAE